MIKLRRHTVSSGKPVALIYVILVPTTALIGYAKSLRKLLANRQFFVVDQMAVSL